MVYDIQIRYFASHPSISPLSLHININTATPSWAFTFVGKEHISWSCPQDRHSALMLQRCTWLIPLEIQIKIRVPAVFLLCLTFVIIFESATSCHSWSQSHFLLRTLQQKIVRHTIHSPSKQLCKTYANMSLFVVHHLWDQLVDAWNIHEFDCPNSWAQPASLVFSQEIVATSW